MKIINIEHFWEVSMDTICKLWYNEQIKIPSKFSEVPGWEFNSFWSRTHVHDTEVKKTPEHIQCSIGSDTWHPPAPGCSLTRIKFPWAHEPRIWQFKPITK